MFLESALVGSGLGLLRGGKLRNLAEVQFRGLWAYAFAFALQMLVKMGIANSTLASRLYVISFIALGAGAILDRHYRGMTMITAGVLSNGIVILANNGKMPVALPGRLKVNLATHASQLLTHGIDVRGAKLQFMSDIIPIWTPFQGTIIVSIGDIVLAVGLVVLAFNVVMGRYTARTTHQ